MTALFYRKLYFDYPLLYKIITNKLNTNLIHSFNNIQVPTKKNTKYLLQNHYAHHWAEDQKLFSNTQLANFVKKKTISVLAV